MLNFRPNCTIPSGVTTFVSAPNVRGTLDIVWSSFTVLILCVWTIQHLNVPAQITPQTTRQEINLHIRSLAWKLKWMLLTVFAPECLLGKSFVDLLSAAYSSKTMKEFAAEDMVEWTTTHGYFANMGWFVIKFSGGRNGQPMNTLEDTISPHDSGAETMSADENARQYGWNERHNIIGDCESPQSEEQEEDEREGEPSGGGRVGGRSEDSDLFTHGSIEAGGPDDSHSESCRTGGFEQILQDTPGITESSQVMERMRSQAGLEGPIDSPKDVYRKELCHTRPGSGKTDWVTDSNNLRLVSTAMRQILADSSSIRLRSRQRNLIALQGSIWVLDAAQLRLAREIGIIQRLPDIPKRILDDRNKVDGLVKAIAILQITWLIIELIVRAKRRLASSQLELVVASFSLCSTITFALLWSKPKDVNTTMTVQASRYASPHEMIQIANEGPTTFFRYRKGYWIPCNTVHKMNSGPKTNSYPRYAFIMGSAIGAIIFGAPHLVAWNFLFPSSTEQLLWRVSALVTVIIPMVGIITVGIFSWLYHRVHGGRLARISSSEMFQKGYLDKISVLLVLLTIPYALARAYIIVEAFRSLAYLPADAYVSTWTSMIPHGSG